MLGCLATVSVSVIGNHSRRAAQRERMIEDQEIQQVMDDILLLMETEFQGNGIFQTEDSWVFPIGEETGEETVSDTGEEKKRCRIPGRRNGVGYRISTR